MLPLPTLKTISAASLLALGLNACASPVPLVRPMRPIHLADVQVVDRTTGERLPIYGQAGARWIAGTPGHRYAIEVLNRTGGRLLAVMAVDGVNVVSGETAGWDQRGYVFGPGARYEVAGWRKSQQQIAAFEFAALPDSYAARTGRPDNIGVIGVALFREAPPPAPPPAVTPEPSQGAAPVAPSADAAAPRAESKAVRPGAAAGRESEDASRLGTAHGAVEGSYVAMTTFERAQPSPDEVVTIRYDRRENLVAMGIIPPPPVAGPTPLPFPLSAAGFVPDPPAR